MGCDIIAPSNIEMYGKLNRYQLVAGHLYIQDKILLENIFLGSFQYISYIMKQIYLVWWSHEKSRVSIELEYLDYVGILRGTQDKVSGSQYKVFRHLKPPLRYQRRTLC